jgi:nicotinamidase-related amidase
MMSAASETALLVIDVQRAFFEPEPRPFEAEAVVARIARLAAVARAAGSLVVFVRHTREDEGTARGSRPWGLIDALEAAPGDVLVDKTTPDAFLSTGLHEILEARGIWRVLLCGYATEYCVDTTARRAGSTGYGVTVVSDAHTTHDAPHARASEIRRHHNATFHNLEFPGKRFSVNDTEQVLSGLSQTP